MHGRLCAVTPSRGLDQVYFSGAPAKTSRNSRTSVLDGQPTRIRIPGYSPGQFPDNTIVELPSLFKGDARGNAHLYRFDRRTQLNGYQDYFVIGATSPNLNHPRPGRNNSIDDLKGKRIRVNNASKSAALEKLGAIPVQMPINDIANAIAVAKCDAAPWRERRCRITASVRVATHHYLLETNGAPLALL